MYVLVPTKKNDELMHYGVLGMKWGVHRTTSHMKTAAKALGKQQSLQKARFENFKNSGDKETHMSQKEIKLYNKYRSSMDKAIKQAGKTNDQMNKYREKEYKKIDNRWGVANKEKQSNKAIEKFEKTLNNPSSSDKDVTNAHTKAVNKLANYYAAKGLSQIEKTNFSKKTINDIGRDKISRGKSFMLNVVLNPAPITGSRRHARNLAKLNGVDRDTVFNVSSKAYKKASKDLNRL